MCGEYFPTCQQMKVHLAQARDLEIQILHNNRDLQDSSLEKEKSDILVMKNKLLSADKKTQYLYIILLAHKLDSSNEKLQELKAQVNNLEY